jgi:cellulose biosynthesis protein BcsQ
MSKVVTFYSFKGGAGRTVCTANVAHFIAKKRQATPENAVLLLDMDLDSAGLTIMLDHFETYRNLECSSTRIATGKFEVRLNDNRDSFRGSLKDISNKSDDPRTVLFLGARVVGDDVLEATGGVRANIRNLFDVCDEEGIGTVLIDSASGQQEVAQICHDVSNVIVYCCRLTRQFILGTKWNIESFMKQRKLRAGKVPDVIIYPVAVPASRENWKKTYEAAMAELQFMANVVRREGLASARVVEPVLSEVESFKWEETILVNKESPTDDEIAALASYSNLADAITELLQ